MSPLFFLSRYDSRKKDADQSGGFAASAFCHLQRWQTCDVDGQAVYKLDHSVSWLKFTGRSSGATLAAVPCWKYRNSMEFPWCHSEFQVVVNKLSEIPWGTAFMDLTFDLNSAFASLRTRGSWDLMVLLPKESQISDIFSPVARSSSADQDFLGKSNSKDLKRSLLLSSGGEGPKGGI